MPRKKEVVVEEEKQGLTTPAFISMLIFAGIVIVTGAVYLGKSDSGAIDVAGTIEHSNQVNREQGNDESKQVDVVKQEFQNLPNGGLVPQKRQDTAQDNPQVVEGDVQNASSTGPGGESATTTEQSAEATDTQPISEESTNSLSVAE